VCATEGRIRIFASTAGDVLPEIQRLKDVVASLNTEGSSRNTTVELLRWETHAVPAAGRPQGVIAQAIGDYEIYIGIMWKHFGTPTGYAASGTEEEFNFAYASWYARRRPRILFYFSHAPYVITTSDELAQLSKVIAFRERIAGAVLFRVYKTLDEFTELVRRHLVQTLHELASEPPLDADAELFLRRNASDPRNDEAVRNAARAWFSSGRRPGPQTFVARRWNSSLVGSLTVFVLLLVAGVSLNWLSPRLNSAVFASYRAQLPPCDPRRLTAGAERSPVASELTARQQRVLEVVQQEAVNKTQLSDIETALTTRGIPLETVRSLQAARGLLQQRITSADHQLEQLHQQCSALVLASRG